jgi:hypothetical protein
MDKFSDLLCSIIEKMTRDPELLKLLVGFEEVSTNGASLNELPPDVQSNIPHQDTTYSNESEESNTLPEESNMLPDSSGNVQENDSFKPIQYLFRGWWMSMIMEGNDLSAHNCPLCARSLNVTNSQQ